MRINELLLNKYRIEKLISQGSFSTVFRATEQLIKRTVAIKVIPKSAYTGNRIRYFFTELHALGINWEHPNIVSIHTVEPGDGEYVAYIVMEFVDGIDLQKMIANNPPSTSRAVCIAIDICTGLSAAHRSNIIHRDIKPQNILLTSDFTAKISDFGVARILEETSDYAATITGTRKYMSPEQYDGNYDIRTDLYATGLIIYEMLVHRYPFSGRNHDEIKQRKLAAKLQLPIELDADLSTFLHKALAPDPRDRYQTASEMTQELVRIRNQQYAQAAQRMITAQSARNSWTEMLQIERQDWRIPTEVAEQIEADVWRRKIDERDQVETKTYADKVGQHYDRAGTLDPLNALKQVKQAALLSLTGTETIKTANGIFNKLLEVVEQTPTVTTVEDLLAFIQQQPQSLQKQLTEKLLGQQPTTATLSPQSAPKPTPAQNTTKSLPPLGSGSSSECPPATNNNRPESALRSLHQSAQYAQETKAIQILTRAENYEKQGKAKSAQKNYRELGDFYAFQAKTFVEKSNWGSAANCFSRAHLAYQSASKIRSAKRCARSAGDHYIKLAVNLERNREWRQAGKMYEESGDQYSRANVLERANESWLRGTICYFNFAENEHNAGKLKSAYEYCQLILTIGQGMLTPSYAVSGAQRLMQDIINYVDQRPSPDQA